MCHVIQVPRFHGDLIISVVLMVLVLDMNVISIISITRVTMDM